MERNNLETAALATHIGKRSTYEDNFLCANQIVTPDYQKQLESGLFMTLTPSTNYKVKFYAVSDGMGGHNAGDTASRVCVEELAWLEKGVQNCSSMDEVAEKVQKCLEAINNRVCTLSKRDDDLKDMGATLVLFVEFGPDNAIYSVGDSRAYIYDGESLKQLTTDHTAGQRIIDMGILTPEETYQLPVSKDLNRYIGYDRPGLVFEADEIKPELTEGTLLLCSDGLTDALTDKQILKILQSDEDLKKVVQRLVKIAALKEKADNVTAILVPIGR